MKQALDPRGILNPGKLGLPSPFGTVPFPSPDAGRTDAHSPDPDGARP
jgi:hypothetical protein